MIRSILLFISILCVVNAFLASSGRPLTVASRNAADHTQLKPSVLTMVKDKSRSGTKRDRLDKLAELEDSRVETDKGAYSRLSTAAKEI